MLLSRAIRENGITVNTRHLYALCLAWGRTDTLFDVAEAIGRETRNGAPPPLEDAPRQPAQNDFSLFLTRCAAAICNRHRESRPADPPLRAAVVKRYFILDDDLEIDLKGLSAWLTGEYAYTVRELGEVMLLLLREASGFTSETNSELKRMLQKMREIQFIQQLETAQGRPASDISEFYDSTPPEALIPYFSQNILEVHLVQPCRERLAEITARHGRATASRADRAAGEEAPVAAAGPGGQTIADNLFG